MRIPQSEIRTPQDRTPKSEWDTGAGECSDDSMFRTWGTEDLIEELILNERGGPCTVTVAERAFGGNDTTLPICLFGPRPSDFLFP